MAGPGRDKSIDLTDGRVIEYWDGGDPAGHAVILHPGTPETRVIDGHWPEVLSGLLSIWRQGRT